jgi:fatty acid amide hydrolase 2
MNLLELSATELAALIRKQEVSSEEVVRKHIERAMLFNPVINAIVQENYHGAIRMAKEADAKVKRGEALGAFHGVPCTIKECFAMEGMPQSSGVVQRKDFRATENAPAVQRILDSGAIPLGVTNTSELCMWYESANKIYGRTSNPYNPSKIVGGSSGGEGAIVGSGASPFGLGSDIGGSIRMPAFFNGVFGHKGSGGLIPNRGQYPAPDNPIRILSTGPLSRRAADLMPLVNLMKGKDGIDESVLDIELQQNFKVDYSTLQVFNLAEIKGKSVDDDLKVAQQKVVDFLVSKGATNREFYLPAFNKAFDIWSSVMAKESGRSGYAKLLGYDSSATLLKHFILAFLRVSPHTFPSILLGLTENSTYWFPKKMERMIQLGEDMKEELNNVLGGNSILLFPSHPRVAPSHYIPYIKPFAFVYTGILNIAEIPVTQVPLGLNEKGLPLGVQVGAAHGKDHLTIAVAEDLEQAFGGWVLPSDLI